MIRYPVSRTSRSFLLSIALIVLIASIAALPLVSAAAVRPAAGPLEVFVAISGSDTTGIGTEAQPYRSITKAMSMVGADQTIVVGPGTYDAAGGEYFPIALKGGVTLRSSRGRYATIIDGGGSPSVIDIRNFIYGTAVRGFTITGGDAFQFGGGIYMVLDPLTTPVPGWPLIESCEISGNEAPNGGGVFCDDAAGKHVSPRIMYSEVSGNTATEGGGITIGTNASPTITGCTITGNTATTEGGGVSTQGGLSLRSTLLADNQSATGGGVSIRGSEDVSIVDCVIRDNTADPGSGGGVSIDSSAASIDFIQTEIVENDSLNAGGGLYIYGLAGERNFSNCLIADNWAVDGGAIWARMNGDLVLDNSTVAGNTSTGYAGIFLFNNGLDTACTIRNSVLWHAYSIPDNPSSAQEINGSWSPDDTALSSNIHDEGLGDGTCIHADPMFVNAAAGDYRLRLGSPSIDAGNSAYAYERDLDGALRPQDGDRNGTAVDDHGAYERPKAGVVRISGPDRYATACEIARDSFAMADTAIIASGQGFPDALSASGLAGAYDAPLLLVAPTYVPQSVYDTLDDLGVSDLIIVGGTNAIGSEVFDALEASGRTVTRISGSDRYATSTAVAEAIAELPKGLLGGVAFVARGDAFPDALAVGPLAYGVAGPVLLTRPTSLSPATKTLLQELGIDEVVVAGGTVAVSAEVFSEIDGLPGVVAVRKGGADRYSTASAIAEYGVAQGWCDDRYVGVATGLNFPDALAGGVSCGRSGGLILLTQKSAVSAALGSFLGTYKDGVMRCTVFGGTVVVEDATKSQINTTLGW